jgi:hypothetical protein
LEKARTAGAAAEGPGALKTAGVSGALDPAAGGVRLDADFEGAFVPKVEKKSDTHFVLDFGGKDAWWWMFRLKGVAGKTVRVDLKGVPLDKWCTLNPLYQNASEARSFLAEPLPADGFHLRGVKTVEGHNGTRMPAEAGMGWRYIPEVWAENGRTLSFVQTFKEDVVKVAMRVPFTLSDEAALMAEAEQAQARGIGVEVVDLDKTSEGRTLHLVKVSSGYEAGEKTHPCILMYAREHADEQDSSWAVAGALRRILGDDEVAKGLREKYTFMFIPVLDMDSAAKSAHAGIIKTFRADWATPESLSYAGYFQEWIARGNPLEIVFNFHNMESAEGEHLVPPTLPADDSPFAGPARALHRKISAAVVRQGYTVRETEWYKANTNERLGGWLGENFGALFMPYELNLQNDRQHLGSDSLQALGMAIEIAAAKHLQSAAGLNDTANAAIVRERFLAALEKMGPWSRATNFFALDAVVADQIRTDAIMRAMSSEGK